MKVKPPSTKRILKHKVEKDPLDRKHHTSGTKPARRAKKTEMELKRKGK